MAQKKAASPEKTNVRRIKANDDTPKKPSTKKSKGEPTTKEANVAKKSDKAVAKPKLASSEKAKATNNPLKALGGYFKGAWEELKQVRWPNRKATWGMTLAVLLFTAIFIALILLLDAGFKWAFEQILK